MVRFADPAEHEAALLGWDQQFTKLDKGQYRGAMVRCDLIGCSVIYEEMAGANRVESAAPKGTVVIGMPVRSSGSLFKGRHVVLPTIYVPDGEAVDATQMADTQGILLNVEGHLVPHHARGIQLTGTSRSNSTACNALRNALLSVISRYLSTPKLTDDERRNFSGALISKAVDVIDELSAGEVGARLTSTDAYFIFKKAEKCILEMDMMEISVAKLSELLSVPAHMLRAAFLSSVGVSPRTWIKFNRLAKAHRLLLDPKNRMNVSEVSGEVGIFHYSRFSQYYKETYGVLPSNVRPHPASRLVFTDQIL